jgi:hypothetical protein
MKRNIFIWLSLFVFIGTAQTQDNEDRTRGLKKISQAKDNSYKHYHHKSLDELVEIAEIGVEQGISAIEINLDNLEEIFEDIHHDIRVELHDVELDLKDLSLGVHHIDVDVDLEDIRERIEDIDVDRIVEQARELKYDAIRETNHALKNLKSKRQKPQE